MNDLEALFEIVTLKSGIKSLRSRENREIFHPGIGPLEEAKILHVNQHRLAERAEKLGKFVLWDVGFGAAANAVTAIETLRQCHSQIEIHSFDRTTDPIKFALNHPELQYLDSNHDLIKQLVKQGHVQVRPGLNWHLHLGDFRTVLENPDISAPDSIFYDPYSPSGNHEMWTLAHFMNLYKRLDENKPCLLSNYTRSTAVRVTLLLAGFKVGVGCLIGDKEETTLASNHQPLLERPLEKSWLERVKISGNGAPMTGSQYSIQPINTQDYIKLTELEQFKEITLYKPESLTQRLSLDQPD